MCLCIFLFPIKSCWCVWSAALTVWIVLYVLQYTEEKLGQAEKTELDAHLENLIARADCTKNWTDKIFRQTEVLLQPNPSKNLHRRLMFKIWGPLPKPLYCKILCYWILFEMCGLKMCWKMSHVVDISHQHDEQEHLNQSTLMSPFAWLHHVSAKKYFYSKN